MAGLVADYGSDSESNSSSQSESDEEPSIKNRDGTLPKPRLSLPKPDFKAGGAENIGEASVFVNPFVEADKAKKAILEKHVKMISTDVKTLNGKKICWNYRKNKCRFGHNCKYAHDSDLQIDPSTVAASKTKVKQVGNVGFSQDEEEEKTVPRGKKRPGLSQNIVPGKKVLKAYNQQKWKNNTTK